MRMFFEFVPPVRVPYSEPGGQHNLKKPLQQTTKYPSLVAGNRQNSVRGSGIMSVSHITNCTLQNRVLKRVWHDIS